MAADVALNATLVYILYRYICIKLTKLVAWISVWSYAYNN